MISYLLVLAATGAALVSGIPYPYPRCLSDGAIMHKCLTGNRLKMADLTDQTGAIIFDPEVIQKRCSDLPRYIRAFQCIISEYDLCRKEAQPFTTALEQMLQSIGRLCNDSSIKFECLAQVKQKSLEIQACVKVEISTILFPGDTPHDIACRDARLGAKCVVDLVSKCDEYTGAIVGAMASVALSSLCSDV